jgi:hypothetical protein
MLWWSIKVVARILILVGGANLVDDTVHLTSPGTKVRVFRLKRASQNPTLLQGIAVAEIEKMDAEKSYIIQP